MTSSKIRRINFETQESITERFTDIVDRYGNREGWGYAFTPTYMCRSERLSGIAGMELKVDLTTGKRICPIRKEICEREIRVPNPAHNVAGVVFANELNHPCPLCGLVPESHEFKW